MEDCSGPPPGQIKTAASAAKIKYFDSARLISEFNFGITRETGGLSIVGVGVAQADRVRAAGG